MDIQKKIFYTKEDYALLAIVEQVCNPRDDLGDTAITMNEYLHPNGIKQLFLPREFRIAHAIAKVLSGLEQSNKEERLLALRSLQEESIYAVPLVCADLRYNTARVLVKVMKELIKARGNIAKQLHLAHSFQRAARGNLYIVRKLLEEYHLLEMPEQYNQLSFDHHVHDMYSKGTKSPSQVLLDAWIQGVRTITVVYYNYICEDAVSELIESGEILSITTHFGIEYHLPIHDTFAEIVWSPMPNQQECTTRMSFFQQENVIAKMKEGQEISNSIAHFTEQLVEEYNTTTHYTIEKELSIPIQTIMLEEYLQFVGKGQSTPQYLAEYIYSRIHTSIKNMPNKKNIEEVCTIGYIIEKLQPTVSLPHCTSPFSNAIEEFCSTSSIYDITKQLFTIAPSSFVCLNISKLTTEDVLTLLWEAKGNITHLELFNLKDWLQNNQPCAPAISALQYAINTQDIQQVKRIVRTLIQEIAIQEIPYKEERLNHLKEIFHDIPSILHNYIDRPLEVRLGSDSAGGINRTYSIGFVFEETIPSARKVDPKQRFFATLPIYANLVKSIHYSHKSEGKTFWDTPIARYIHRIPLFQGLGRNNEQEWNVQDSLYTVVPIKEGNIIGTGKTTLVQEEVKQSYPNIFTDINIIILCYIKIVIAFLIAFITFRISQSDIFLQYCGGFIWLGITVTRLILQTTYAVGIGTKSFQYIRNNIIFPRVADLLLATGIAVFIIEYLARYLLLQQIFNINVTTHPITVFVIIGITSVSVILGIGRIRGLPKQIVFASASRVFFSVPVALLYQGIIATTLTYFGVENVDAIMESTATLIAKLAADSVVGIIIGVLLRHSFVKARLWDYTKTLQSLFAFVNILEEKYPDKEITFLLKQPTAFIAIMKEEQKEIVHSIYINLLDLFYFWHYTSNSHTAFINLVNKKSPEYKKILMSLIELLDHPENVDTLFPCTKKYKNYEAFIEFYKANAPQFVQEMRKLLL